MQTLTVVWPVRERHPPDRTSAQYSVVTAGATST
jgi:hypothetical protein